MNNWELHREQIEKIKETLIEKEDISAEEAYMRAIIIVTDIAISCIPDAINWLTQEAESDHIGEVNEMVEPQQSKARFIKTKEMLIKTDSIIALREYGDNATQIFCDPKFATDKIEKPVNEVIQQLGIEVV